MKLEISNLKKSYNNIEVIRDINLTLEDDHIIGIIGPSGGGKSTLLRMMAGLENPDSGEIIINNMDTRKDQQKLHKQTGYVFQSHHLFLHLSVLKNITLILEKIHGLKMEQAEERAMTLLQRFGLAEHSHKKPYQLSGGQAQRVAIVRALAIDPQVLFFDEPTSALDPILTYEVLEAIQQLKQDKKDFIIVTHEIGFAREVADYILFIDEGKIIEQGDVSIIDSPQTKELKNFLGKVFSFS